jgi:aspartokinase/homoserine dehydrogenase 1
LFETNVGAGLPIIDTVKNLVASGDQVNKIQAVLSGSLNFIFNNFDENNFEK